MLSVRAGRTACRSRSPKVTASARHSHRDRESDREPSQPDRKDQKEQDCQPERRSGGNQKTVSPDQTIRPAPPEHARRYPENQPEYSREHPGRSEKENRTGKTLPDDCEYRLAVEKGCPHISVKNVPQPSQVPLHCRSFRAPVRFQTFHLLRTHGSQRNLTDVRLQRIQRRRTHQQKCNDADSQQEQRHPDQLFSGKLKTVFQSSSFLSVQVH